MVDRNMEIWKGQALNIAKDEQMLNPKTRIEGLDLDLLFKRAKQIFYKAFDYDFFEWKPKKDVKPEWIQCKKCGAWCDKANYNNCKCGEPINGK